MKKTIPFIALIIPISILVKGQDNNKKQLKKITDITCECVQKISLINKNYVEINNEISNCINASTKTYQIMLGYEDIPKKDNSKEDISIIIDSNSKEYQAYYREIERSLFMNCATVKDISLVDNQQNDGSISVNPLAIEEYNKGKKYFDTGNYKKAISYFEKAINIDSKFAFAWDDLGISYRKMNDIDKAIECYENSLAIDPNGKMPLMNIGVAYIYKKNFEKAIIAYKNLAKVDSEDPESYFGLGNIYLNHIIDYELALDNFCKANMLYSKINSPYRTETENIISQIYIEMKKQGQEEKFYEICKKNNINFNIQNSSSK